ncbi:hypothetical protein Poli38472_006140 [Pythium oligandrum]|uniref:Uncharacterized protein n=1 Tax=Pythium oligandrum TaxID=41045 RepID=A0A8K1FR66_PYTOL|nr:hypothetical protein Poli38472_006140 [Pythium oligandrum]|eukprot:TMW68672.1 hypothetical protein Poli38472_006140 [Pythium oligandrum]
MVVLQHDQLHHLLWGPASRDGRSKRGDTLVYMQLVILACLAVWQAFAYEKPTAFRLAAFSAVVLLYFRNVALCARLLVFLSCLVLYGDVFVPVKKLMSSSEAASLQGVLPVLAYTQLLFNNIKLLFAVYRAMPRSQRRQVPMRHLRKSKYA